MPRADVYLKLVNFATALATLKLGDETWRSSPVTFWLMKRNDGILHGVYCAAPASWLEMSLGISAIL
jgi:hypothetical protein